MSEILSFLATIKDIIFNFLRSNLLRIIVIILVVVLIGATGVIFFEAGKNSDQFDSMWGAIWWALVTITTVGYGDKVPVTTGGRIIGAIMMFTGVALVSIFTATISSIFVAKKIREGKGLEKVKFEKHILLCGWNNFAESIIMTLSNLSENQKTSLVLVNQLPEDEVSTIMGKYKDLKIKFVKGDFANENVLHRANVEKAYAAILIPDETAETRGDPDEKTILATLTIKSIEPKVRVFAHLRNIEHRSHLKKAKADEIVISDEFSGYLIAAHVMEPGIPQTVAELLNYEVKSRFKRYAIPSSFVGKTYNELFEHVRKSEKGLLIGLSKEEEAVKITDFLSDDPSYLDAFIQKKFEQSGRSLSEEEGKISVNLNPPEDYIIKDQEFGIIITRPEEI
ncbi:MAG: potassium channel family protein [Fidelibacterota bacterium]